jgi:hypothetical protein
VAAPLEFLPLDQLRRQLEVNLVGPGGGRPGLPAGAARGARANRERQLDRRPDGGAAAGRLQRLEVRLEGVSDSLRRELYSQGVDVIVIEPGGVKTPIWRKGDELASELVADMPPEAVRLYGRLMEALRRETAKIAEETGIEPRAVAEVIGRALTAKRPRARYLVGRDAKLSGPAARLLPDRVMDRIVARSLGA